MLSPLVALRGVALAFTPLAIQIGVTAQEWRHARELPARTGTSVTYDPSRESVVVFGGYAITPRNDTWVWDRLGWSERTPALAPDPRYGHDAVFDTIRQRVLVHGGRFDVGLGQHYTSTWAWDGTDWQDVTPTAGAIPQTSSFVLAFDGARDRLVLLDTSTSSSPVIWEFDGASWRGAATTGGPSATLIGSSFDQARGRVMVLTQTLELWSWDGQAWTRETAAGLNLPAFDAVRLFFDEARGALGLFVVDSQSTRTSTAIWHWDGATWSTSNTYPTAPAIHRWARYEPTGADHGLLFTADPISFSGDVPVLWEFDKGRWTRIQGPTPQPRSGPAMTYDRALNELVLRGGTLGHPVFDDDRSWSRRAGEWVPTPDQRFGTMGRAFQVARFDPVLGATLLFGNFASDLHEWNGSSWVPRATAVSPRTRQGASFAGDTAGGRTLMFGGRDLLTGLLTPYHWTYDGQTWFQWILVRTPPACEHAAMALDPNRQRVVLFGGRDDSGNLSETWEWDGSRWAQRLPTTVPPARHGHVLAYHEAMGRTVLYGGTGDQGVLADTWSWDGSEWTDLSPVVGDGPRARSFAAATYNATTQEIVLFGGEDDQGATLGDLWYFGLGQARHWARLGTGCDLNGAQLELRSAARPVLGTRLSFEILNNPSPQTGWTLCWMGLDTTAWNGVPLPLSLRGFGAPQCSLFAPPDLELDLRSRPGAAVATLDIPMQTSLAGLDIHVQAGAIDFAAGTLATSGALSGTVAGN